MGPWSALLFSLLQRLNFTLVLFATHLAQQFNLFVNVLLQAFGSLWQQQKVARGFAMSKISLVFVLQNFKVAK